MIEPVVDANVAYVTSFNARGSCGHVWSMFFSCAIVSNVCPSWKNIFMIQGHTINFIWMYIYICIFIFAFISMFINTGFTRIHHNGFDLYLSMFINTRFTPLHHNGFDLRAS